MWARQSSQRPEARQPSRGDGQRPQDHTCQYRDDLNAANARIRRLEARMEEERARYKQEITSLQQELSIAKTSAWGQGKELTATVQADRLSISEARATIDTLNKVLASASASMVRAIIPHHYPDEQRTAAIPRFTDILGPNVPAMLIAESRRNTAQLNESLVYTILQLFLVHYWSPLVTQWYPVNLDKARILKQIYRGLRSTEDQSVFGRWRALACSHISISRAPWQQDLLTAFEALLVVAGWKVASDADSRKFKDQLQLIFETAIKARRAVWELVTSVDLKVTHVIGGTLTKSGVAGGEDEIVAGTFYLGLDEVTRTGSTEIFAAGVVTELSIRQALQPSLESEQKRSNLSEPGVAHTALPKPIYIDGVEQRAARNPLQG